MALRSEKLKRGFTLIELIVVMGILVIVSTLMFTNNSQFGGVIFLENLAYDVALSLRKAQVYGIAVRRFGSDDFSAGYGIQFDVTTPQSYVLFADVYPGIGNGLYDPEQSEQIELNTLQSGYEVADLCATQSGGSEECSLDTLNILFKRPEPDAYIRVNDDPNTLYEGGRIILESPRGQQISVTVEVTGQIAVQ